MGVLQAWEIHHVPQLYRTRIAGSTVSTQIKYRRVFSRLAGQGSIRPANGGVSGGQFQKRRRSIAGGEVEHVSEKTRGISIKRRGCNGTVETIKEGKVVGETATFRVDSIRNS